MESYYPPHFIFSTEEINTIQTTPAPWAEQIFEREMIAIKLLANDLSRKQVTHEMCISQSVVNKKIDNVFRKTGYRRILAVIDFLKKVGILPI